MRFSYWLDTSNPWQHMLEMSRLAEQVGWEGIWLPDHFMPPPEGYPEQEGEVPELGEVRESWTLAAALATLVPRVRVGHLVLGNTYRHPAVVANMAAGLQEISGGRFVLGIGAAWQENEHRRYGIHYGTTKERIKRFEEACEVIHLLFTQERATFAGQFYALDGAPLMPKPTPLPSVMIGAVGERYMLPIVAKYADEWNMWGLPEAVAPKMKRLDELCESLGRDPKSLKRTAVALLYWADTEPELQRQRDRIPPGRPALLGTASAIQSQVAAFRDIGIDELIIPDFNFVVQETAELLTRFQQEVVAAL